jgi:uncharacterized membrane protein YeaQ/YmgE (transglycosylase-associated protein family)
MELVLAPIAGSIIGWVTSILLTINSKIGVLATVIICAGGSLLGVAALDAIVAHPYGPAGGWVVSILGAGLIVALLQILGGLGKMAAARRTARPVRQAGIRQDPSTAQLLDDIDGDWRLRHNGMPRPYAQHI